MDIWRFFSGHTGPQLPHIYKLISAVVPIIISQGVSAALQNYLLKVLSFLQPEFVHLVLM